MSLYEREINLMSQLLYGLQRIEEAEELLPVARQLMTALQEKKRLIELPQLDTEDKFDQAMQVLDKALERYPEARRVADKTLAVLVQGGTPDLPAIVREAKGYTRRRARASAPGEYVPPSGCRAAEPSKPIDDPWNF